MTTIAKDTAVRFNYILKDESGNVIDQSQGEPLAYLHGHNNIIPGLEKELECRYYSCMDRRSKQYNKYLANFQGVDNIQPGMQFQSEAEGQVMLVTVTDVNEDTVTVDANHPLAGKKLSFDVEIVEVRAATEDELNHGHVHGVGGVQH